MQDQPTPIEILGAAIDFIRNQAMPQLQGHTAFHARVCANALDIVKRELELAPTSDAKELESLRKLLSHDGTLVDLNNELCALLKDGKMGLDTPGLTDHLWSLTMAKLAVDQPRYSGYTRSLEEGAGS